MSEVSIMELALRAGREVRRHTLRMALDGTANDRLNYAVARSMSQVEMDLTVFGRSEHDPAVTSRRAVHWFNRLERIASR